MLIEHTFITTLDAPEAMRRASEFLCQQGFEVVANAGFQLDGGFNTLQVRRGKKKAHNARSISELPQQVHLQFDRGRINLAASIEVHPAGGFYISSASAAEPTSDRCAKACARTSASATNSSIPASGMADRVFPRTLWRWSAWDVQPALNASSIRPCTT